MERQEWRFGQDEIIFEPPDVMISRGRGELKASGLENSLPILEKHCVNKRVYLVLDMTFATGMTLGGRSDTAKRIKTDWFLGVVVINANTVMRLGLKALYLATGYFGMEDYPLEFVKSMDEAHAVIDADRVKRAKAASGQQNSAA